MAKLAIVMAVVICAMGSSVHAEPAGRTQQSIQDVINYAIPDLRGIYDEYLDADNVTGRVVAVFDIAPNGLVVDPRLEQDTLPDSENANKFRQIVLVWLGALPFGDFSANETENTTIRYPFVFQPSDKSAEATAPVTQ